MKKIVLSLLCGALMCSFVMPVLAQELTQKRKTAVFSPAVMAGSATQAQKGQQVKKALPKTARTTILRFEPGQIELSDVQKELLLHVARQLQEGYVGTVIITAASEISGIASKRAAKVEGFLRAYKANNADYYIRTIQPEHVVPSVNNTVKITINR